MHRFLESLLHDLAERYRFLESELAAVTLPMEADGYRDRILKLTRRGRSMVEALLVDPDLREPTLAKNFYQSYKRLAELAQSIDEGPAFALSRFRSEDRFVTKVVQTACQEVGFPHEPPLCVGMSAQYYCALIGVDLIMVPHSEATYLLGWPDLYHELGHFLIARNEVGLLQPLRSLIYDHFDQMIQEARRQGWTPGAITDLEAYRSLWLEDWIVEFASDWFATFALGPTFAWANLRLCMKLSSDVFGMPRSHPADSARTVGVVETLKLMGLTAEAEEIRDQWDRFLGTVGYCEPQLFSIAYPTSLFIKLTGDMVQRLQGAGLRAYAPGTMPLADMLHDAWVQFRRDGFGFTTWERDRLRELRTAWGDTA